MPRCEISGVGPRVKNLVSHSNIKTKSRCLPNIQSHRLFSPILKRAVRLRVSRKTLKSLEHRGGLDAYLLGTPAHALAPKAAQLRLSLQRCIKRTQSKKPSIAGGGST